MKAIQLKKNLKTKLWRLAALFAIIGLGLSGCAEDDPLEDPSANRDRYLGVWQVTENTGINHPQFYAVNIVAGSQDDEIIIEGLYNEPSTRVDAVVSGTAMTIPNQNTAGINFIGDGTANTDFSQLLVTFTANDGSGQDVVEAVMVP